MKYTGNYVRYVELKSPLIHFIWFMRSTFTLLSIDEIIYLRCLLVLEETDTSHTLECWILTRWWYRTEESLSLFITNWTFGSLTSSMLNCRCYALEKMICNFIFISLISDRFREFAHIFRQSWETIAVWFKSPDVSTE